MPIGLAEFHSLLTFDFRVLVVCCLPAALLLLAGCGGAVSPTEQRPAPPPTTSQGTLTVSPASLSFGTVTVGQSDTLPFTLTDTGNAPVKVSTLGVSGAGFAAASGNPLLPLSLAPGASAQFTLTFAPQAAGASNGAVTLVSDAVASPLTLALSGVGATAAHHAVTLRWAASSSPVAGYNVYRAATAAGPFTRLTATPVSATQFSDSTVQGGLTYFYAVSAVDAAGVESAYSNLVSVTIPGG